MRERIIEEFRHDPEVATLIDQIKATSDELEHAKSIARRDADPAVIAARKRLANLKADYNDLWSIRSEQIRQRLLIETGVGLGRKPAGT